MASHTWPDEVGHDPGELRPLVLLKKVASATYGRVRLAACARHILLEELGDRQPTRIRTRRGGATKSSVQVAESGQEGLLPLPQHVPRGPVCDARRVVRRGRDKQGKLARAGRVTLGRERRGVRSHDLRCQRGGGHHLRDLARIELWHLLRK